MGLFVLVVMGFVLGLVSRCGGSNAASNRSLALRSLRMSGSSNHVIVAERYQSQPQDVRAVD